MKTKSLFLTLASGAALAYATSRLLEKSAACADRTDRKTAPQGAAPSDFESHANPRTPLSEIPSASGRTGSGLDQGTPRPAQTSDWYGNEPGA